LIYYDYTVCRSLHCYHTRVLPADSRFRYRLPTLFALPVPYCPLTFWPLYRYYTRLFDVTYLLVLRCVTYPVGYSRVLPVTCVYHPRSLDAFYYLRYHHVLHVDLLLRVVRYTRFTCVRDSRFLPHVTHCLFAYRFPLRCRLPPFRSTLPTAFYRVTRCRSYCRYDRYAACVYTVTATYLLTAPRVYVFTVYPFCR